MFGQPHAQATRERTVRSAGVGLGEVVRGAGTAVALGEPNADGDVDAEGLADADTGGVDGAGAAPGAGELLAQPLTTPSTIAAIDAAVSPDFAARLASIVVASLAGHRTRLREPGRYLDL
jgi:hypothetical protein